jgi:hypothetical protein
MHAYIRTVEGEQLAAKARLCIQNGDLAPVRELVSNSRAAYMRGGHDRYVYVCVYARMCVGICMN